MTVTPTLEEAEAERWLHLWRIGKATQREAVSKPNTAFLIQILSEGVRPWRPELGGQGRPLTLSFIPLTRTPITDIARRF